MKILRTIALCALTLIGAGVARAQEAEAKLVDEVVARVNGSVILRSAYLRAQQDLLDELKSRGLKDAELEKQFNEMKPIILDQLIDTELLAQRAKELSLDVEPQVNQQLLRIMKENNLQSLDELEQKMREVGVDINEVRRVLRTRFASDAVRSKEVFGKIYFSLTEKDKRDYYEQHKELFTTPGEVTLSRIFFAAGKDPAQSLARAKDVTAQARVGSADFVALAKRYSEEELGKKGGLIGAINIPDLSTEVRTAIGDSPVGTVTDPVKLETPPGYAIFRIDARKEAVVKPFEGREVIDDVGQRIAYERGSVEMDKYLEKLRDEAFIEVDPRYQLANSKVKSAQIKRVPYSEENRKGKKKKEDTEKKDKPKEAAKTTVTAKP